MPNLSGDGFHVPVEIGVERYLGLGGKRILELQKLTGPFYARATELSLVSEEEPDPHYLKCVKDFMKEHDVKALHLAAGFCSHKGIYLGKMFPAPHSQQTKKLLVARLLKFKEYFECPLAIENISHQGMMISQFMETASFFHATCEEAQVKMLLHLEHLKQTFIEYGDRFDSHLAEIKKLPLAAIVVDDAAEFKSTGEWIAEVPLLLRGTTFQKDFILRERARLFGIADETFLETVVDD